MKLSYILIFIGIVALALLISRQSFLLATTRVPENYTELYFTDPLNLPKIIISRQVYNFSFTIHNLENRDLTYPYEVVATNDRESQVLESSSVFVPKNGTKTIPTSIGPLSSIRKKITVNLTNKSQFISFWMDLK